jgi:nucleoside-diphosphate-sugar epimerase
MSALEKAGIEAFRILLTERAIEGPVEPFLNGLDVLVINIPPGLRSDPDADFVSQIALLSLASKKAQIPQRVFVSSTSVFGPSQGRVTEHSNPRPDTPTGKQLLEAESKLLSEDWTTTQVLRPGGLLGPDRHPVRSLSGRTFPSGGNQRVNLVEQADVLTALQLLISQPESKGVFHAVYPDHPVKREYYQKKAGELGIPSPKYLDPAGPPEGKEVVSQRLTESGFRFAHPI